MVPVQHSVRDHLISELPQRHFNSHRQGHQPCSSGTVWVGITSREGTPHHLAGRLLHQLRPEDSRDHNDGIALRTMVLGCPVIEVREVRSSGGSRAAARTEEQSQDTGQNDWSPNFH